MDQNQQLGKYLIVEELGKGLQATVYRAIDTVLDRDVALKIFSPQLMMNSAFIERFYAEAKTAAKLQHPSIITILDFGNQESRLFLAMTLAANGNLQQMISRQKQLSWIDILYIVKHISEALDYSHSFDIIHCDIKPANCEKYPRHRKPERRYTDAARSRRYPVRPGRARRS